MAIYYYDVNVTFRDDDGNLASYVETFDTRPEAEAFAEEERLWELTCGATVTRRGEYD